MSAQPSSMAWPSGGIVREVRGSGPVENLRELLIGNGRQTTRGRHRVLDVATDVGLSTSSGSHPQTAGLNASAIRDLDPHRMVEFAVQPGFAKRPCADQRRSGGAGVAHDQSAQGKEAHQANSRHGRHPCTLDHHHGCRRPASHESRPVDDCTTKRDVAAGQGYGSHAPTLCANPRSMGDRTCITI